MHTSKVQNLNVQLLLSVQLVAQQGTGSITGDPKMLVHLPNHLAASDGCWGDMSHDPNPGKFRTETPSYGWFSGPRDQTVQLAPANRTVRRSLCRVGMCLAHSLIHSLIHSLTPSLTNSLTHSLTHSLMHSKDHVHWNCCVKEMCCHFQLSWTLKEASHKSFVFTA